MDTDTTDRDAVWVDRVIGISSEVENCDGENLGTEHEKEVEALEAGSEVEGTVDSPFQRSNEEDGMCQDNDLEVDGICRLWRCCRGAH